MCRIDDPQDLPPKYLGIAINLAIILTLVVSILLLAVWPGGTR